MGNHVSHAGKVLLPDGSTYEFNEPVTAAELMLEHPRQVVVEYSQQLLMDQGKRRPAPLPADQKLEPGKVYLMLPFKSGKPVWLSTQEGQLLLLRASAILKARAVLSLSSSSSLPMKLLPPFFAKICPSSSSEGIEIGKKDRGPLDEKVMVDEEEAEVMMGNAKTDYLSRQLSGRGWRPSLDTIKEKKGERMMASGGGQHWVVLAAKVGKRIEKGGLVWA